MDNNNNTTDLANDKNKSFKKYAVFDSKTFHTSIVRLEVTAAQFEFKPLMFQMLLTIGQFSISVIDDPHIHLKQFTKVAENFKNLANRQMR